MKKFLATAVALGSLSATSLFANFDLKLGETNFGKAAGKVQTLTMQRDFSVDNNVGAGNSHSTTGALTLEYWSPELADTGLTLKLQYVHAEVLESGGGLMDANKDAGEALHNSAFSILNEAYIEWNLKALGLEKTTIRIGRQIIDLDFVSKYNIRQKSNAIQGIVLTTGDLHEDISLTLAHITKYSSWSSRKDGANDAFDYEFIDVEDVLTSSFGWGEGVIDADGMQAISMTYTGIENLTLTLWDLYASQLANVWGVDAHYTLNETTTLNVKYSRQDSLGEMRNLLDNVGVNFSSEIVDVNLKYKPEGKFCLNPGVYHVFGSNDVTDSENYYNPFVFDHLTNIALLNYTNPYIAGATGYYLKVGTKIKATGTTIAAFGIYVNHDNSGPAPVNYDAYEVDMYITQNLPVEGLSATVKLGYGHRDGKNGARSTHATDARLFVSYVF